MNVLVTGGCGYIGSHACIALIEAGHNVVVLDNLCNSSEVSIQRVKEITQCDDIPLYIADVGDADTLSTLFNTHEIHAVMHFAGLKAVGESGSEPLKYYNNNVAKTLVLCEQMREHNIAKLIFSSSATVYGDPATVPIDEGFPLSATNPYGRSKLMVEDILRDLCVADTYNQTPFWNIALLRYFNPAGAHSSGIIGEDPRGIPNNLLPYITQVAIGKLAQLSVFGDDYNTPDGTGVRDYIHVMDLVEGHVKALEALDNATDVGCQVWNLGTGQGYSVLEMINAFEEASGKEVPYQVVARRPGDIAACWANPEKAKKDLKWQATRTLPDMMADSWRWQHQNPEGY